MDRLVPLSCCARVSGKTRDVVWYTKHRSLNCTFGCRSVHLHQIGIMPSRYPKSRWIRACNEFIFVHTFRWFFFIDFIYQMKSLSLTNERRRIINNRKLISKRNRFSQQLFVSNLPVYRRIILSLTWHFFLIFILGSHNLRYEVFRHSQEFIKQLFF